MRQVDWQANAANSLGFGAMVSREKARSESFGDPMSADTDMTTVYAQDRISAGRHSALRGARLYRS